MQKTFQNWIFHSQKVVHIQLCLTYLVEIRLYGVLTYTETARYGFDGIALLVQHDHLFYLTHGSGFSGHWVISFSQSKTKIRTQTRVNIFRNLRAPLNT